MFNLVELQQSRAHKALTAQDLVDKAEKAEGGPRPMSEDEIKIFDRLTEEITQLDAQISAVEAHNRRREQSAKLIEDLERGTGRQVKADPPANGAAITSHAQPLRIPASARRTGVLKAFKGPQGEEKAYRAGLWLRAMVFSDQRAAQRCMDLGIRVDIRNAMGTASNPDGGFLVMEELSQAIIDLRETYGWFRNAARVWPMGSDTLDIPRRAGGVTIGPVGENPTSAISQSNPAFSLVKLVAKKAGGLSLLSSEIAEDAVIDLADWVAQEFAYGFALFEDQCAYLGDGTSTYMGITGLKTLFSNTSLAGSVQAASGHDTMAEIDNADLTSVMAKLPQYARPMAKWYCSATFADAVFTRLMAVAGGNNVQTLSGDSGVRSGGSYLGYPIMISQVMESSTGTINLTPYAFFGDMTKSSALGDRRRVSVFPSEHRYMDTDQIGIRGIERFDIVHNDIGDNSTPGPLVALLGKT